jgi:hypothetical protein
MSDEPASKAVDTQHVIEAETPEGLTRAEAEQQKAAGQLSNIKTSRQLEMHAKVYSPFRDYFDGQAFSLSAVNLTGPFDILPKHHNFISLLSQCDVVIRSLEDNQQKTTRIRISGGIIHVKADEVLVFLDV